MAFLQTCGCYNSHTLTNVSATVTCVADLVDSHKSISITLLVVVPALVVFFILLDALGRLRRGSYDKLVLRWVRHKGAPGLHCNHVMLSTSCIAIMSCCQHHTLHIMSAILWCLVSDPCRVQWHRHGNTCTVLHMILMEYYTLTCMS